MPASLINSSSGDVFSSGAGGASAMISVPGVDGIVGGLAVYDTVSMQINDTIQYFLTFDDAIKYIFFGKGVGTFTAEGTMYCTCDGSIPSLSAWAGAVGALRGQPSTASIGGATATVVLTSAQVNVVGEPDTMAKFIFTFAIVDHQL
jgi:hypothetical protein